MRSVLLSLAAASALACGGGSGDGSGLSADASPPAPDAATAGPGRFSDIASHYDTIETIAGVGAIRDKGVSGWQPSFEGADANTVELSRPHMAQADSAGNIYVADKDAHAVRMISTAGSITTVAGTGESGDDGDQPGLGAERRLSSPNGIWVRGDGTVYILDLGNDKVRRLDTDGQLSTLFSIGGAGLGRGLWVADDESRAYIAAGTALKTWSPGLGVTTLASGFSSLGNLAVASDGTLAVTDRLAHRVFRIERDGSKVAIAGNGTTAGGGDGQAALATGLNEVRGIWFHPDGGYLLATHKGGQIWYVDGLGDIHLFVDGDVEHSHSGDGEHFQTPGKKISEPRAISVAPSGDVLITESDYGFVRRLARVR